VRLVISLLLLLMLAIPSPSWEDPTAPWKRLAQALAPRLPRSLNLLLLKEQGEYLRGLCDRDVCPFAHGGSRAAATSAQMQAALRERILSQTGSGPARARAFGLLGHQIADHSAVRCGRFRPLEAEPLVIAAFIELWARLGESTAAGPAPPRRTPPASRPRAQWTFTNHDLEALPPAAGTSRVTADGLGKAIASAEKGADAADRKRFAGDARRLRLRLEKESSEVEQLRDQLEQIERERRRGVEERSLRSLESTERRLRERMQRAEAGLEIGRRELDALEQRARRAGLLPGDLRD